MLRYAADMADAVEHWDQIFSTKAPDQVSWFQREPAASLRLLRRWSTPTASLVDIGAGDSTLVDRLLDEGWRDVTVLDISAQALERVQARLATRAASVSYVASDLRSWNPDRTFGAWHDRAVFHFLVEPTDRDRYVRVATEAIEGGGVLVMATFAADGPTECSGLPTSRYEPEDLAKTFGAAFALEHAEREEHLTPFGTIQPFSWVVLRRR